jgi:CBS domain-containing protein
MVPAQLISIAQKIQAGESPDPVTVRTLLAWFDRERRGTWVVRWIRDRLSEAGLTTEPDFDSVWIDGNIRFRAAAEGPSGAEMVELTPKLEAEAAVPQAPFVGGAVPDPTHKVGKLEAANRGVVGVSPDDSIERAVTLMMANSHSQLPVMVGEREVKGMVNWESIARKLVLSGACRRVMDCAEQHREIASDASLFAAIPEIVHS